MKSLTQTILAISLLLIGCGAHAETDEYSAEFSEAQLEQILAPIALYPDSVLTHVLIASTYPLEVVAADRWVSKHPDQEPADALRSVEDKNWDPSVKALVAFPKLLEKMSENLEWTQQLGDAFIQSEERVLESIQTLRRRADAVGNLDKMEHMQVTREDKNIIIQPVEREVIYVPYYDTRVVYGNWYWPHHPPVYWNWTWHDSWGHHYNPHSVFHWHPRSRIAFNFYFGAFNWHNHHVIVVDHHDFHSRHYYHRSQIVNHRSARVWRHNPTHRRGVAYRTEQISRRFESSRPSVRQTQISRNRSSRQASSTSRQAASNNDRVRNNQTLSPLDNRRERVRNQLNSQRERAADSRSRENSDDRSSRRDDRLNRENRRSTRAGDRLTRDDTRLNREDNRHRDSAGTSNRSERSRINVPPASRETGSSRDQPQRHQEATPPVRSVPQTESRSRQAPPQRATRRSETDDGPSRSRSSSRSDRSSRSSQQSHRSSRSSRSDSDHRRSRD